MHTFQNESEAPLVDDAAVALIFLWEALVPVSFVLGIVAPVLLQFVMYDRPLMNPITIALLLILPYKFCPGAAWRWI